jgi:hypothetical protein
MSLRLGIGDVKNYSMALAPPSILLILGITVAASTVWEILKTSGVAPVAPPLGAGYRLGAGSH